MNPNYTDIPRFYTALAECFSCFVFVLILKNKVSTKSQIVYSVLFLILQSVLFVITGNIPLFFWIPVMIIAFLFMLLYLNLCCEGTFSFIGYNAACAFLQAEFAASLEWQLHCFLASVFNVPHYMTILLLVAIYGCLYYLFYILEKLITKDLVYEINKKEFILSLIIAVLAFSLSNLNFIKIQIPLPFTASSIQDIFNFRTLIDCLGLGLLYAYQNRIAELQIKTELSSIRTVLEQQYQNFLSYQESVELVHIKYHDLKHLLTALQYEKDHKKVNKMLEDMQVDLAVYETNYNTGNKILDTILSSKQHQCKRNNITFTIVAEGQALNFIQDVDICSIFGNGLDNAIQASIVIPDKEKKIIQLKVVKHNNFLIIQFENYFTNAIKMENNLPRTNKKNKLYHGFGLKSIMYTVKKYDGNINIETKNNWFNLQILIPVKD